MECEEFLSNMDLYLSNERDNRLHRQCQHRKHTLLPYFLRERNVSISHLEGKEVRSELFHAQMSNPDRMIPLEGTISNYTVAKDATKAVIQRSLKLGKDIEQNLDARLSETPPNYVGIPSSAVTGVELSKGNDFSLPHSIIRLNEKKLKFHLVRCNFSGRGN